MPLPVRSLPVLQNWDCHGCGECCREYLVRVTDAERARIEAQGWEDDPALKGTKPFRRAGPLWRRKYHLNHRPDGSCVFLDEKGLCRIHAKFGPEAKPLACRVYPFMLVPAGDHWRVGLRFACPSASRNLGRPLGEHQDEVRQYAAGLEEREGVGGVIVPPPMLGRAQSAPWSDLFHFIRALRGVVGNEQRPLEWRLRKMLALAHLCREARFDKVTGRKLVEFLELIADGIDPEVPEKPEQIPPPGWVGRILFRQTVALCARKDNGPNRGISRHGRLALLWAAWRFARGTGRVPRVHGLMPQVRFDELELPAGPLPEAAERMLTRYYLVKLESAQFCGPTNYGRAFWDGLESLVLTFPAILWLARVFRDLPREEALTLALRVVDDNFGFNPLLGTRRQLLGQRIMARRGDLARLVAWYGR
jgi:lysine-N-methylase